MPIYPSKELPSISPSSRERGEGACRAGEGLTVQGSFLMFTPRGWVALQFSQFDDLLKTNELVFIDVWAERCAPCKQFALIYERVAEQNPTLKFVKVNIEENAEFNKNFHIRSIPHLMVFKQGILIFSEAGSMPESMLNDLVQQAMNADVSEIRAQVAYNR